MAFKVGSFEGVTIVGITDPHLAAAVRALGSFWEEVQDLPGAQQVIAEAVRMTEELAERAASLAQRMEPAVHRRSRRTSAGRDAYTPQ